MRSRAGNARIGAAQAPPHGVMYRRINWESTNAFGDFDFCFRRAGERDYSLRSITPDI
jgi:hypothetical protein